MFFQSEIARRRRQGGMGAWLQAVWVNANSLKSGNALIASLFTLSLFFCAGLVSKSTRQIPQTGEATAEGAGTVCDPLVQRHDAEHTGLQCLARLSAISASQHHESLSPGKLQIPATLSLPLYHSLTQFSSLCSLLLQDLFQMGASSYPGMTQPFSMAHSTNMGSVGVRQDSMGKLGAGQLL